MTMPKGVRKRQPTEKQAKAASIIKEGLKQGKPLTQALVVDAHDKAYELGGDRGLASTYAGQNMRKPAFLAQLGLDAKETQETIKEHLFLCLSGEHPHWKKDKEIFMLSLRLLAKYAFTEHSVKTIRSEELSGRQTWELKFKLAHDVWPETAAPELVTAFKASLDAPRGRVM